MVEAVIRKLSGFYNTEITVDEMIEAFI
jgi:hypothetical protein